jgi:hypothetical protein
MGVAMVAFLCRAGWLCNSEYDALLSGTERAVYLREAATWTVEWGWLAYLALWVPRLTVVSIRLLRNSANKRD